MEMAVKHELFHADRRTHGRTDMTKLLVALRNFANAPRNQLKQPVCPGQDSELIPSNKNTSEALLLDPA